MPVQSAIELNQVSVRRHFRTILEVSRLTMAAGRITALVGPNGAGKTTLVKLCLGLLQPTRGSISILGQPTSHFNNSQWANLRQRIGYVPQTAGRVVEAPITVREVVSMGRTARAGLFHALSHADKGMVDRWMEQLGLASLSETLYTEISGGEQRKCLIARALAQEPELLLLDEPTAHLDLGGRETIVRLVGELHKTYALTVLWVCHELEDLPPACESLQLLDKGCHLASGKPETVMTPERLAGLYGVNLQLRRYDGRYRVTPGGM